MDRDIVTIQLDVTNIRRTSRVCFEQDRCWVSFTADFIIGNPVSPVSTGGSLNFFERAQNSIPDTTPPQLVNFDLDMDSGDITVEFDEPIRYIELELTAAMQFSLTN